MHRIPAFINKLRHIINGFLTKESPNMPGELLKNARLYFSNFVRIISSRKPAEPLGFV